MQYFETELFFNAIAADEKTNDKSPPRSGVLSGSKNTVHEPTEVLGILLRLGNQPLVYSLKKPSAVKSIKGAALSQDESKDYYLVVHAIGAVRTQGRAKVDELQYYAEVPGSSMQTIALVPDSRFREVLKADLNVQAALAVNGEVSLSIPAELTDNLTSLLVNIGGGMELQLCANSAFIGKFSFSIRLPVIQASGIATNTCAWVLNPDENNTPLLGDQLLVQSIAVPKGTTSLTYKISGLVKADKGLFWKQKQQRTPEHTVTVKLC